MGESRQLDAWEALTLNYDRVYEGWPGYRTTLGSNFDFYAPYRRELRRWLSSASQLAPQE